MGTPVDHGTFLRALAGDWRIVLAPRKPVPRSWFPPLDGARVLGPVAGGGSRCPSSRRQGHVARCLTTPVRRLPFDPVEKRTLADGCARATRECSSPIPPGSSWEAWLARDSCWTTPSTTPTERDACTSWASPPCWRYAPTGVAGRDGSADGSTASRPYRSCAGVKSKGGMGWPLVPRRWAKRSLLSELQTVHSSMRMDDERSWPRHSGGGPGQGMGRCRVGRSRRCRIRGAVSPQGRTLRRESRDLLAQKVGRPSHS